MSHGCIHGTGKNIGTKRGGTFRTENNIQNRIVFNRVDIVDLEKYSLFMELVLCCLFSHI
jgi:hypothetical protein